jgi:integrase
MNRMEPLSRDELLSLLRAARESSTRDWCLLVLMYAHGLRSTEAGQLLRSDLNERDWTLNVKRLKGSAKTLQVIYPNGVKLLDARKAITEWLQERPRGLTCSQTLRVVRCRASVSISSSRSTLRRPNCQPTSHHRTL